MKSVAYPDPVFQCFILLKMDRYYLFSLCNSLLEAYARILIKEILHILQPDRENPSPLVSLLLPFLHFTNLYKQLI